MVIESKNLEKSFKSYKKYPGLMGSFKSLYSRDYTKKTAVGEFDLNIKKGEIIGLLGPNGAGKTTLMKMFTGIIVPTSGKLEVLGHRPSDRDIEFRKKIALVMGQKSQLWWDIPAMDSLSLIRSYYEIAPSKFQKKVDYMSKLLGVEELLHIQVRRLSLGERMKLELMSSLLHEPEIIFLDEPTIGLDLVAQENIRNFIKDYHREFGATIILTSHYMEDVKALCKRLVLIFDGRKAFDGPIEQVESMLGNEKSVHFDFSKEVEDKSFFENFQPSWDREGRKVELQICEDDINKISAEILNTFPVSGFQTDKLPIEKVMKEFMINPDKFKSYELPK